MTKESTYTVIDQHNIEPGQQCPMLGSFTSESDASKFIGTLPDTQTGRYGIDGPI